MSSLASLARALMIGAAAPRTAARPAPVRMPTTTVPPRKKLAGDRVVAAWQRLQSAQAQADEARRGRMRASIDRLTDQARLGNRAHELRLAGNDATAIAENAAQVLAQRKAEFAAAVREFYAVA